MADQQKQTFESGEGINETVVSQTTYNDDTLKDYNTNFLTGVHKWGRLTMVLGFIFTFSPFLYLYFVKGYREPAETYLQVILAVVAFGIGLWLTEPLSYFPVLGSAGTYMSYFAGNVGNMRLPVAISVQNFLKEDSTTPRGNIATIFALVASVITNIVILLIIIALGSFIIKILPENVNAALKYVSPALFGSIIAMQLLARPKFFVTYFIPTAILYFIVKSIPAVSTIALPIVMACVLLFGYAKFKSDIKKGKLD